MALHHFKKKWYLEQLQLKEVESTMVTVCRRNIGTQTEPMKRRRSGRNKVAVPKPMVSEPQPEVMKHVPQVPRRGRGRPRLLDSMKVFNHSKASSSTGGLKAIKKISKKSDTVKTVKPLKLRKYEDDDEFRVSKPRGQKKGNEEEENDSSADARYCLCHKASADKMIYCENDLCPLEWFHFKCVGLRKQPKGEWYCPNCRGENSSIRKSIKSILQDLNEYNHQYDKEVAVEMKN